MNRKILLITLFSLFLAGCNKTTPQPASTPTSQTETVQQMETASLQMNDAFTSGKPLQCDVSSSTAGESPSTYYIKNGKMRMETQATAENTSQYFSINDGTTVYVWSSDPTVPAMKFSLEDMKKSAEGFDNQLQSFPDLTDEGERQKIMDSGSSITCDTTNLDDSLFVPPADIMFKSFEEMMGASLER
ncbi:MAG: hypothetical protein QG639_40 [Patescibacteria group bacterium]|nr:hypothetical protein [Patescibacteria group bacterium]